MMVHNLVARMVTRTVFVSCQFKFQSEQRSIRLDELQGVYNSLLISEEMKAMKPFIDRAVEYFLSTQEGDQEPRLYSSNPIYGWDPFKFRRYVEHTLDVLSSFYDDQPIVNVNQEPNYPVPDFSPLHYKGWVEKNYGLIEEILGDE